LTQKKRTKDKERKKEKKKDTKEKKIFKKIKTQEEKNKKKIQKMVWNWNTKNILIGGVIVTALSVAGYLIYFDYKRQADPEFRKKLSKFSFFFVFCFLRLVSLKRKDLK